MERAFRTLKGVDLQVRPIRHRLESRVKAHIFLSMLAYYVQWHLAKAWKPLLFADGRPADEARERNPVAAAERSAAALAKAHTRRRRRRYACLQLSQPADASGHDRAQYHALQGRPKPDTGTFTLTTVANPKQRQAIDLAATIAV